MSHTHKATGLLVLIFLICLCSCGKIAEQRKMHYFEKGKKLYESGNYIEAQVEFENAIMFDPNFYDAYYLAAMSCYKYEDYDAALESFRFVCTLKPEDIAARLMFVETAIKNKRFGQAIKAAEKILGMDKNNREALRFKLKAQIKSRRDNQYGPAKKEITLLKEQGDTDPLINCLYAETKIIDNDLPTARAILAQQTTFDDDWVATMKMIVEQYEKQLNYDGVMEIYNTIIEKVNDKRSIQNELLAFLNKNRRGSEEEHVLKEIVKDYPDDLEHALQLINCLISLGKFEEAEQLITSEAQKDPKNFDLKKLTVEIYKKKATPEEALKIAKAILASLENNSPQYIEIKNIIADIYFSFGKYEDSKAYAQEILAAYPKDGNARFLLCKIDLQGSSSTLISVIGNLRELISEYPQNADIYYYLGMAHKKRDELVMAGTAFNEALDKSPGHREALFELAELNMRSDIHTSLEGRINYYLKINPNDAEVKALSDQIKKQPY